MPNPDFSARDKVVKHNVYASVRRRDGLPHDLFAHYWRDVHSTLCSRLPGLNFYVQQHFDRDHFANFWPVAEGVGRIDAPLDGSAELGFANLEEQAIFAEAGKILYSDESNFIGEAVAYNLPNGSLTFVDRDADAHRNGPDPFHRIHVYMSRKPDQDSSVWLKEACTSLATHDSVVRLKLHLPEPYDNTHPAPPSPNVDHIVGPDRLNLAIAEIAFTSVLAARTLFSSRAFKSVHSEQARYIEAIGVYRVTGFYTFVRDGQPTLAGVRGSRPAELIQTLGAANQVADEVVSLFGILPAAGSAGF
ncbi:EthD domain-containing protein [Paraburkholderia unamae]|uniref:Methylmuconolactone methyl-isomerase n=1 Tax=Paraburkholderia unamae TaxID=219649 RepID=A0ABX5KMG9_9BURK|nr:EthD domain-containing protein [Paraburkholderia unamae]PVX81843.1 methylmuconolactone methyl-isomerase [Paraburkholderia unamae]